MSDMYLFVFGVRPEPVVVQILAWSSGMSVGGRYDSRSEKKVDEFEKRAQEWTEDEVQHWLSSKLNFSAELLAKFKSEGIDGKALTMLDNEELKIMIPQTGPRMRTLYALRDLQRIMGEVEASKMSNDVNLQDLSCTCYLGALTQLAFVSPLLSQKKLPRCVLVTYTSGPNRNRGWGGNENDDKTVIPPGTAYIMLDLREVTVTSWSTGGSGGEDRLTGNASLQAERIIHSSLGIKDHKDLSWEVQARALGVDARDPAWDPEFAPKEEHVKRCMGASVLYDGQSKKGSLVEFGAHVRWSKATHRVYPVQFQQAVRTLLLCTKRKEECDLYKIPKDVVLLFIKQLASSYNASPFSDFPHPNPASLKPKDDENANDDQ